MKGKFKRFAGDGYVMLGDERPSRAWQIECKNCRRLEHVFCHGTDPSITWRRFEQLGWRLGKNTGEDECGDCAAKRREAHRKERDERRHATDHSVRAAADKARHDLIESMSPATLIAAMQNGSGKIPDEPDAKARVAVAVLIQEILTNNPWDLHEVRDLIPLVLRYWMLADDVEQRRDIRSQIKIAAFSTNRKDAAAARVEIHRLLSQVDEARDAALRTKLDEAAAVTPPAPAKSPAQKFSERFGDLKPKPKLVPPKPEQWFLDTAPKPPPPVAAPRPAPIPAPEPIEDEEPAWLRKARLRHAAGSK